MLLCTQRKPEEGPDWRCGGFISDFLEKEVHLRCKEKDLQIERQQEERSRPQNLRIERPRGKREEQKL